MTLTLAHVELREANAFVEALHRHHKRVQGHRFSLGARDGDKLVGVVIVGRPVGGAHQDEWCEVTRLCTDGTPNACSFLYQAAARGARALGFKRIQTYILGTEPGISLKAAGWKYDRLSHPVGWHHDGSAQVDLFGEGTGGRAARNVAEHLADRKQLWAREL